MNRTRATNQNPLCIEPGPPPLLGFAAPSGVGKTTLLEPTIRALAASGLRVAALKHDGHDHPLDKPGADTDRFRRAGALGAAVVNAHTLAVFRPAPAPDPRALARQLFPDADLVLVEGFRAAGLPTVRVRRAAAPEDAAWSPPRHVVAWVSDGPPPDPALPCLPLDRPDLLAAWISSQLARLG